MTSHDVLQRRRLTAEAFPSFRTWTNSLIRESRAANSRTIASVRSVQPLATTIISSIEAIRVSWLISALSNWPMFACSLYAMMPMQQ